MEENSLQHHGILGQKWGIRRYQNYDGTYTKRGLERYKKSEQKYNEAVSNYDSAKKKYDSGNATKQELRDAKLSVKENRKKLNQDYRKLKDDKRADQGKQLYKQGKTISGNAMKNAYAEMAILGVSAVVGAALKNSGKAISTKYGQIPVSLLAPAAIAVGGSVVNAGLMAKTNYEDKRLRAYYAH